MKIENAVGNRKRKNQETRHWIDHNQSHPTTVNTLFVNILKLAAMADGIRAADVIQNLHRMQVVHAVHDSQLRPYVARVLLRHLRNRGLV